MRTRLLVAAAGAAAITCGSTGAAPNSSAATLDRALRDLVAIPGGPPGAVSVVQRGTTIELHRAGVADRRTRRPIQGGDHIRLASVAKAFSGAVALTLVARGRLSLDSTIGRLLPKLPRAWRKVTLRQALQHTSGLPEFSRSPGFQKFVRSHLHARVAPLRLLRFVFDKPLEFRPGTRYRYSNTDNFIAALMAEAVTHRPYEHLLSLAAPVHLTETTLPGGAALPSPYLHGYDGKEDVSTLLSASLSWAAGGIVSTPADLNRFIRGYAGGKLFGGRVRAAQLRFVAGHSEPPGPGRNAAGLSIFRYRTRCGTVYGHTGNTPGYTEFAAATLDGRRSVTVTISEQLSESSTWERARAFEQFRRVEEDAVCAALSH